MAKLKAPLFSLGASGQLGKALVFFPWKGLDCVREFVIPANPQTTAQTTHRDYLKAAVAKVHEVQAKGALGYEEEDKTAYSAWGSTFPTPRTWFNQAVKNWVDLKVDVKVPIIYRAGQMFNTIRTDARPLIYIEEETGSQLAAGKFYLGTSKTALIKTKVGELTAGEKMTLGAGNGFDDLSLGVKYFWQFRADAADPCEGSRSGIYYFVAT